MSSDKDALNSYPERVKLSPLPAEKKDALEDRASDKSAQLEAKQISSGKSFSELQEEALAKEHERSENFRNHFEQISIGALYLAAVIFGAIACVWAWHICAPEKFRFLSDSAISNLQSILTGGILVGAVADHLKKRLG